MRRLASVSLLAIALLLVAATPSHAWRHGFHGHPGFRTHVFIGVGPSFWWGPPYPYWWYPPYPYSWYPPTYYAYSPPPVIVQQPPVYVQQPPAPTPAAPPPQAYWYYCSSAKVYYPTVQTCPEVWVKVPPTPE